jgi:hypothetical protein
MNLQKSTSEDQQLDSIIFAFSPQHHEDFEFTDEVPRIQKDQECLDFLHASDSKNLEKDGFFCMKQSYNNGIQLKDISYQK